MPEDQPNGGYAFRRIASPVSQEERDAARDIELAFELADKARNDSKKPSAALDSK
jgi:hypothetical protein